MFDAALRPTANAFLDKFSGRVQQSGLNANKLTLIGFLFGLVGCFAAAMQIYPLAFLLIILNRLMDGLAASVARQIGVTRLGSYLDMLCDIVFYAAFVFFFSMGQLDGVFAATLLIFAYTVMFACYLLQPVFAPRDDTLVTPRGGLIENAEIVLFMLLCCALPAMFAPFATVFALLCLTTAVLRVAAAVRALNAPPTNPV